MSSDRCKSLEPTKLDQLGGTAGEDPNTKEPLRSLLFFSSGHHAR